MRAEGKGTCAGLTKALDHVPSDVPFLLIWSDLVLDRPLDLTGIKGNAVGLSTSFPCRWRYHAGRFEEIPSSSEGVAGLFLFKDKNELSDVPSEGEFVRYLSNKGIDFEPMPLTSCREMGTLEAIGALPKAICRPFNRIRIEGGRFIKEPITKQGEELARKEQHWYRSLEAYHLPFLPKVYSYDPLTLEEIKGSNPFTLNLDQQAKRKVLRKAYETLETLHGLSSSPGNDEDIYACYFTKTFERLNKIKDLVPFAGEELIKINDVACPSPFKLKEVLSKLIQQEFFGARFTLIHGDPSFSNIMIDNKGDLFLIDPRGYFGSSLLYGDPLYDEAKLYYSFYGDYDAFNAKRFELYVDNDGIRLDIESSGFAFLEDEYFSWIGEEKRKKIKLLHALLWLSLTTYAFEDYDSICGAFYNGTYLLREALILYGAI